MNDSSPIAPFFMDNLFKDLNSISKNKQACSVHLTVFPVSKKTSIDVNLEKRMQLAQKITTIALSLRKQNQIRVRQPLEKITVPVLNSQMKKNIMTINGDMGAKQILEFNSDKVLKIEMDNKSVITDYNTQNSFII